MSRYLNERKHRLDTTTEHDEQAIANPAKIGSIVTPTG